MDRSLFILLCKKWTVTTFKHSKMHAHNTEYHQKQCTAQRRIKPTKRLQTITKHFAHIVRERIECYLPRYTPATLAWIWITVKCEIEYIVSGFWIRGRLTTRSYLSSVKSMFMGFVSENKCRIRMMNFRKKNICIKQNKGVKYRSLVFYCSLFIQVY